MAYIVLALGVLMALVGLGAMATGYPVIEIERGWATVISGAVLLSGGIVTAALGIVVRVLVGLRGTTQVDAVAAPPAETPSLAPQPPPATPLQSPAMPATATGPDQPPFEAAPAFAVAAPAAVATAAAFAASRSPEQRVAPPEPAPTYEEPAPAYEEPEPDYEEPGPTDGHGLEGVSLETHEPEHADLSPEPEPEPTAHEEAHAKTPETRPLLDEPPHPPQSEAWLDQAFQAFDYEMTSAHPPREKQAPSHAEPEPEPPNLVDTVRDEPPSDAALRSAHEAELYEPTSHDESAQETSPSALEPAAEAPATAPEAPSNLTVIGRYDSEGTSYVMYSDGSIEAQSDAGVYRFGSMAELKAFIEG